MARICIPDQEYKERVQRCAAILRREKLDALIVNGNEADYANPATSPASGRCSSERAWPSPPAATPP